MVIYASDQGFFLGEHGWFTLSILRRPFSDIQTRHRGQGNRLQPRLRPDTPTKAPPYEQIHPWRTITTTTALSITQCAARYPDRFTSEGSHEMEKRSPLKDQRKLRKQYFIQGREYP